MTSKNLFSADAVRFQKLLFRRRIWPAAVTALVFFILHILYPALVLSWVKTSPTAIHPEDIDPLTGLTVLRAKALAIFGTDSVVFYLMAASALAVMLAVQGFAWMDSRRELDFYESQPVAGRTRFIGTVLNSVLLFTGIYLVTLLAGLLITAGFGAMSGLLMAAAAKQFLRALCLFLAVYGIATLAAILTGNVIFALLGTGVLLLAEAMFRYLSAFLQSVFLVTWDPEPFRDAAWFSPMVRYMLDTDGLKSLVPNLLTAALALVLAGYAFAIRKRETAGIAVVFAPVRAAVKAWLVLFFGLTAGLFGYSTTGGSATLTSVILTVFFTALSCCIMEIIYSMSFRDLFRHPLQIAVYSAVALAILLSFRFDVLGLDSRVPDPAELESCAIMTRYGQPEYRSSNFTIPGAEEPSYEARKYVETSMRLSDTEGVLDLARTGIGETVSEKGMTGEADTGHDVIDFTVLFRYKNGRREWRFFHVNAAEDADKIDRVIASDDYRTARFFLEDPVFASHSTDVELCWETSLDTSREVSGYEDFLAAYRKDLENFHFDMVRRSPVIGYVLADYEPAPDKETLHHEYPVYSCYANTIGWLRSAGIYESEKPDPARISRITVGLNRGGDEASPDPVVYTDSESIRALCGAMIFSSGENAWEAWYGEPEGTYWIDVALDGGASDVTAQFPTGSVPAFVKSDLGQS